MHLNIWNLKTNPNLIMTLMRRIYIETFWYQWRVQFLICCFGRTSNYMTLYFLKMKMNLDFASEFTEALILPSLAFAMSLEVDRILA